MSRYYNIIIMIDPIRPTVALLLVLVVTLCTHDTCHSFRPSSQLFLSTRSATASTTSSQSATNAPTSSNFNRRFSTNTHFFTDPSSNIHDQTPPPPSFEQRMREQLKQHQSASTPSTNNNGHASSKLVPDVRTLQDYKNALDQTGDDGKMMAVLWYSPWCKACRAVLPGIRTLAKRHPDVQFVQVPVLAENANLHQGLDVPSVPFLHLYVPDDPRLVEEKKMTRKRLSAFQRLLLDYERGSCSLEQTLAEDGEGEEGVWSTDCPYSFPTKNSGELTKASVGIASEGEVTL